MYPALNKIKYIFLIKMKIGDHKDKDMHRFNAQP